MDGDGKRSGDPSSGGGAGPIGGFKAENPTKGGVGYNGENGTGGLLVIYAKNLINKGKIEANGKNGGTAGRSPGGSINLFSSDRIDIGSTEVKGGKAVMNNNSSDTYLRTGRSWWRWNSYIYKNKITRIKILKMCV